MGTLSQRLKISVNAGNPQEKRFQISNAAVPFSSLRTVAGAPRLTHFVKDKMVECVGSEECFVPAGMSKQLERTLVKAWVWLCSGKTGQNGTALGFARQGVWSLDWGWRT